MEFGCFTLSNNHYPDNPCSANQVAFEIREHTALARALDWRPLEE